MSLWPFLWLSKNSSVRLSVCLFVRLSVCLFASAFDRLLKRPVILTCQSKTKNFTNRKMNFWPFEILPLKLHKNCSRNLFTFEYSRFQMNILDCNFNQIIQSSWNYVTYNSNMPSYYWKNWHFSFVSCWKGVTVASFRPSVCPSSCVTRSTSFLKWSNNSYERILLRNTNKNVNSYWFNGTM